MEKLTPTELKTLNELEAKRKRIARAEKEFWDDVMERKEEVAAKLNLGATEQQLSEIAAMYGCSISELLEHIRSERQVNFFKSLRSQNNG